MSRGEVQSLGPEIAVFVGGTRSKLLKALTAVQAEDFVRVDVLVEERNNCITEAHKAQTSLSAKEVQGDDVAYSVIVMYGQDHLMTTILLKDLMKHSLEFYRRG